MSDAPPFPTPDRSRRVDVYWAVALALLAALGIVCWLVVKPVLEVETAIGSCHEPPSNLVGRGAAATSAVVRLGGQRRAAPKLALYLNVPTWARRISGAERESAALLLGHCGRWGLARAIPMLKSSSPRVREDGVLAMCAFFTRPTWWDIPTTGPEREKALTELDPETRALAEEALSALTIARDAVERRGR